MGILRRMFGGGPAVPEWASFFSSAEYDRFIELVLADFRRRGLAPVLGDGEVSAAMPGTDGPARFGLGNLAQICHADDPDRWPTLIAGHIDALRASTGRDLDALAADFPQVEPILRVRLFPDASMGGVEFPEAMTRALVPGITAALVYDFPDATATVPREHAAGWPLDEDELFARAVENLDLEPAPVRDDAATDEVRFTIWYGDSFYVATRVLRLAELLPDGTHDAIVGAPNRHALVVHPIVDATAVASMQAVYRVTADLFRDGPGSISDQPYWWHDGTLTIIPHTPEGGGRIAVRPPDGLVRVLEAVLARDAD